MVVDGIGTLIGAILGSPFGTIVYIGIPVHKRVGARTGYSLMNGCVYLILCLSGVIPTVLCKFVTWLANKFRCGYIAQHLYSSTQLSSRRLLLVPSFSFLD